MNKELFHTRVFERNWRACAGWGGRHQWAHKVRTALGAQGADGPGRTRGQRGAHKRARKPSSRGTRAGAQASQWAPAGEARRPAADKGQPTVNILEALHNALSPIVEGGLEAFRASDRAEELQSGARLSWPAEDLPQLP